MRLIMMGTGVSEKRSTTNNNADTEQLLNRHYVDLINTFASVLH